MNHFQENPVHGGQIRYTVAVPYYDNHLYSHANVLLSRSMRGQVLMCVRMTNIDMQFIIILYICVIFCFKYSVQG